MNKARLTAENVKRMLSYTCSSICVVMLLLFAGTSWAGSLIATWSANTEDDLAGYKIYYGTESGNYTVEEDVGNTTVYVAEDLLDGQEYFFVVKAYDYAGNVSAPSTEVSATVGAANLVAVYQDDTESVKLVWTPVSGADSYAIYRSDVPYFTPQTATATVQAGTNEYVDDVHASGDTGESYYAVQALSGGSVIYTFNTVGAFDLELNTGLNLVSLPLLPSDPAIHYVLGEQLTGGESATTADQIRIWNGEQYDIIWLYDGPVAEYQGKWINSETGLASTENLDPNVGFWIEVKEGHTDTLVTLTGRVPTDSSRSITLQQGFNFVSSCYPMLVPLNQTELYEDGVMQGGVGSGEADIIRAWTGTAYDQSWVVDGTNSELDGTWMDETGKSETTIQMSPGNGYIIWKKGETSQNVWTYPNPAYQE